MKIFRLALISVLLLSCRVALADVRHAARQEVIPGPLTGEVVGVIDGDTVAVKLRVWIGETIETHVRINGIDTPEIHGKCDRERDLARQAREELNRLLEDGKITLSDIRLEKYAGRVLAGAQTSAGIDIPQHMIEKGYARAYQGKKRQPWCE